MKIKLSATLVVTLCLTVVGISALTALAQEAPRITKEELKEMLGNPDVIIIDVRFGRGWENSELRIKGALREDPGNVNSWISKYPKEKTLVLYCS
jgi:rhodanese-related sulfurtransferase